MSFLSHFRPADTPYRVVQKRARNQHFHGRMSLSCLLAAASHGCASLLTYLLAWHLVYLKKEGWVELNKSACGVAGLSERRRQTAVRRLANHTQLLQIQRRCGLPPLVSPVDLWPDDVYFLGHMSWECLKRAAAAQPNGASLAVYLIAWHEYNLVRRQSPVRLGQSQRERLGLKRSAWNRAINQLLRAELLHICAQRPGSSPIVLPLDPWRPYPSDTATPLLGPAELDQPRPVLPLVFATTRAPAG
jgi:hypothetical protein